LPLKIAFVHLPFKMKAMKYASKIILFFIFLITVVSARAQKGCNPDIWDYVYNKEWLQIKKTCKSVTGVIYSAQTQTDGNLLIRLDLDPGQGNLLSEKNISDQYGCLVVVPICACEITYPDVGEACRGYINSVTVPKRGSHVKVTGIYVYNLQHGWYEIHPVTSIVMIND